MMNVLDEKNQTLFEEFLLLGFETLPQMKFIIFLSFLIIYLATMAGNILLIITVWVDHHLHTPMYFFLSNLSFLETSYVTNVIPRLLGSYVSDHKMISLPGCFLQLYMFGFLGSTECFLLTGMSYDRYLAICHPLHYSTLMNNKNCFLLALASWLGGLIASCLTAVITSTVQFCGPREINHFFCDLTVILQLACRDTTMVKMTSLLLASVITLIPFVLTIMSYVYVILTVLQIPSTSGRKKAFSTCSSHLIVVTTFYGSLIIMYVVPKGNQSLDFNKSFSLLYTVLTPMFNPLVYSLRNKEVKDALQRAIMKCYH